MEKENRFSAIQSKGGDHSSITDSKSKASTDPEDTVEQLRIPLAENLTLSKEDNKVKKHEAVCHDYSRVTNQGTIKAYLDKWKRVEKENLEVKKKLKKMEKYNTDCKTELRRYVKRFKEFKNINKDLASKNKQLLIKNQQMRRRITEAIKTSTPQTEDLEERVTKCCENQKKEEKNLTESVCDSQKVTQESERITEGMILTQLKQENQTLREMLELNSQVLKDAGRVELERCLVTIQTERNLLRQELKRLHEDYISLTNSISVQLKRKKAAGLPLRAMLYSSKQQTSKC